VQYVHAHHLRLSASRSGGDALRAIVAGLKRSVGSPQSSG
jgi:hypothetical protein